MDEYYRHIGLDQPAEYQIKIQGRLERDLADWFLGDVVYSYVASVPGTQDPADPVTVIRGLIADQAGLHGLLNYIRDLGFTLLFVDCLTAHQDPKDGGFSNSG